MNSKILISTSLTDRIIEIEKQLLLADLKKDHPDVLWLIDEEKLGVEAAKKIREHLSLKPFQAQGRAVVVESAQNLTLDAQNSLLKTLEEPPEESIILLGVEKVEDLIPTILSRCTVVTLSKAKGIKEELYPSAMLQDEIQKLPELSLEQRFEYIEKLEDKDLFLDSLSSFYQIQFRQDPKLLPFIKELVQAQKWKKANGQTRAILEYLMLKLPQN